MEESQIEYILKLMSNINSSLSQISDSLTILADNSGGVESNHISELNHTLKLIYEHLEDQE
jgi:hypothetical protein